MNAWECPREQDVLDAVASGRWPDRDPELSAHITSCAICADLADVAAVLAADRESAWTEPALPPSDVVWWRAQVRARTEAGRVAARPIVVVQGLGAACAIGLLVALAGAPESAVAVKSGAAWLTTSVSTLVAHVPLGPDVAGYVLRGTILALGIWLALVPIAVYFATDD